MFISNVLDVLMPQEKASRKSQPEKELPKEKCKRPERKYFSYYMQLFDQDTQQAIGYLADINSGGANWIARARYRSTKIFDSAWILHLGDL